MKLKFLLDLLECAFTVMEATVISGQTSTTLTGHNPKLKERIVGGAKILKPWLE